MMSVSCRNMMQHMHFFLTAHTNFVNSLMTYHTPRSFYGTTREKEEVHIMNKNDYLDVSFL